MKESGLTEYWRKKHWPSLRQCNLAFRKFGPRSLTLDDIQSAFFIWGLGAGLALISFAIEYLAFFIFRIRLKKKRLIAMMRRY